LTGVTTQVKRLTSIESTDSAHGGDDTISGVWAAGAAVATDVTFGNSGNAGTITLASGTWQAAGYGVGNGIYVAGNGPNGNGATFNGDNYYTIAAINGATLTLKAGESLSAATGVVNLSLVKPTPAGAGNNIVIGGAGADTIDIGGVNNTVIGDEGRATYDGATGKLTSIATQDPSVGGNDIINVTGGGNVILGGFGADQITVGGGGNVILGDNGFADFTAAGVLTFITTSDQTQFGDDTITVNGDGSNVIFGGSGANSITVNGNGHNTIFGANGDASFDPTSGSLTKIETIAEKSAASGSNPSVETNVDDGSGTIYGGDDTIKVGDGNNVIVGGFGADQITTGNGNNVVLGDSGTANFDAATGDLINIFSTFGTATPGSTNPDLGTSSNDAITLGNGNNVVIGGAGNNTIIVGASGANVIIGADGEADYTNGVLTHVTSTDPSIGGNSTITGTKVNGVFGLGGSGNNVVIGGTGSDTILLGGADNVVLGDNGFADFTPAGILKFITTSDQSFGGDDTITVNGAGNVIFGGSGANTITVNGNGHNVIFGANGDATFDPTSGNLSKIETIAEISAASGSTPSVETNVDNGSGTIYGGDDTIKVGDGNNVIVGGFGADQITTGNGNNVVLGDSGTAIFDVTSGNLISIFSTFGSATPSGTNPDIGTSSNDVITLGNGNNVVIGGAGNNTIIVGTTGANVIVGADGEADYTNGILTHIFSTDPGIGGNSTITGPKVNGVFGLGGSGNNVVIGGTGNDTILLGGGNNDVVGDDGEALFTAAGALTKIESTFTGYAGSNIITVGDGNNNVVIGGFGSNQITAGNGNDVVVGASGEVDYSGGVIIQILSLDPAHAGNNTINVSQGNDYVFGGAGANQITTDVGHNVVAGHDGNDVVVGHDGQANFLNGIVTTVVTTDPTYGNADTITVGNGNDMVLGGFGPAQITAGDGHDAIVGHNGEATFAAGVLAAIWSLDSLTTGFAGNDVIQVGKGNDVVIGGWGADQITTGTGEDAIVGGNGYAQVTPTGVTSLVFSTAPYTTGGGNTIKAGVGSGKGHALIIGGAGSNNINGGASDDIILGGYGKIVGAFNPDGSELLNSDGSWHRDVVTEEVGSITGTVELDSAGHALQPSLASSLLDADVVLLAGAYDSTGPRSSTPTTMPGRPRPCCFSCCPRPAAPSTAAAATMSSSARTATIRSPAAAVTTPSSATAPRIRCPLGRICPTSSTAS
jgi:Ca2+-binding RTX toxin-like protein